MIARYSKLNKTDVFMLNNTTQVLLTICYKLEKPIMDKQKYSLLENFVGALAIVPNIF